MSVRILTPEEQAQHEGIHGRFGDARAQLWARVYAVELMRLRDRRRAFETTRELAVTTANAAVADFDEHYLGGK